MYPSRSVALQMLLYVSFTFSATAHVLSFPLNTYLLSAADVVVLIHIFFYYANLCDNRCYTCLEIHLVTIFPRIVPFMCCSTMTVWDLINLRLIYGYGDEHDELLEEVITLFFISSQCMFTIRD